MEPHGSAFFAKNDQAVHYLIPEGGCKTGTQRASCYGAVLSQSSARQKNSVGAGVCEYLPFERESGSDAQLLNRRVKELIVTGVGGESERECSISEMLSDIRPEWHSALESVDAA